MELSDDIRNFLIPANNNVEMYSHRTTSREVAEQIMKEGFKFSDSFQKTTDEIINDMVYLRYWDTLRKQYGGYIVVIAFNKDLLQKVQKKLSAKFEVQQALSEMIDGHDDQPLDELKFLLPYVYIKGYLDRETGAVVYNEQFDPNHLPKNLDQNIFELEKLV